MSFSIPGYVELGPAGEPPVATVTISPANPAAPAAARKRLLKRQSMRRYRKRKKGEPVESLRPGPRTVINHETGLTPAEARVMDAAVECWAAWNDLPPEHPDDLREVCDAIHVIQNLLAVRIARRAFPVRWPVKG